MGRLRKCSQFVSGTFILTSVNLTRADVKNDASLKEAPVEPTGDDAEGFALTVISDVERLMQWETHLKKLEEEAKQRDAMIEEKERWIGSTFDRMTKEEKSRRENSKKKEEEQQQKLAAEKRAHEAWAADHAQKIALTKIRAAQIVSRNASRKNCGNWEVEMYGDSWSVSEEVEVEEAPPRRLTKTDFVHYKAWCRKGVNGRSKCPFNKNSVLIILLESNLTAMDALACAQTRDPDPAVPENEFLTWTSSNMDYIPEPHVGIRTAQGRADGKFGMEDFGQYPQPYSEELIHHCFIRRRPKDLTKYQYIWREVTEEDIIPKSLEGYAGSAQLNVGVATLLVKKGESLLKKCHKLAMTIPPRKRPTLLLSLPVQMMYLAFALRDSVFDFRQIKYLVSGFQRFYLESMAMFDYCFYWLPKMAITPLSNGGPVATVRTDLMGAFTDDPLVMMRLHSNGIPAWFVRRTSDVPLSMSVINVVPITPATVVTAQANPEFRVLYKGYAGAACSAACTTLTPGGIAYGFSTKLGFESLNPNVNRSRIEELQVGNQGK
jgi:hypothetical protein